MLTPYAFNTADGQFRQVKSTARSAASLPSRSRAAHHNSQARGSAELSKKKGSLNAHTHKQHLLLPATRTMAAPPQHDAPTSSGHRTSAWVSLGLHAVLLLKVASFLLLELRKENRACRVLLVKAASALGPGGTVDRAMRVNVMGPYVSSTWPLFPPQSLRSRIGRRCAGDRCVAAQMLVGIVTWRSLTMACLQKVA